MTEQEQRLADERMRAEIARLQTELAASPAFELRDPAFWTRLALAVAALSIGVVLGTLIP